MIPVFYRHFQNKKHQNIWKALKLSRVRPAPSEKLPREHTSTVDGSEIPRPTTFWMVQKNLYIMG